MSLPAAEAYISGVLSGQIPSCELLRKALERHVQDLERSREDPAFPYEFNEAPVQRVAAFKAGLRHHKGRWRGEPVEALPWQAMAEALLFGWVRREDGLRRFSRAYISMARKNGKTTWAAVIALYVWLADRPREGASEAYTLATKLDQAKIAWKDALALARSSPEISARLEDFDRSATMVFDESATMRALGKEAEADEGVSPAIALVDEYHLHKDSRSLESLVSGMGARQQPLTLIISTAGHNQDGPCYLEEHQFAEQVMRGVLDAPEYLPLIWTTDKADRDDAKEWWAVEQLWPKANPSLGATVTPRYIRERCDNARRSPDARVSAIIKNLNTWMRVDVGWIEPEVWASCNTAPEGAELAEMLSTPCYGGMDLSATQDVTAVCWLWPLAHCWYYRWRFFLPAADLDKRERRERVPWQDWVDQGLVTLTPGRAIDYDYVYQAIIEHAAQYRVEEIAYDPTQAHQLALRLSREGHTLIETRQTYALLSGPTSTLEAKVLRGEMGHGGNPVAAWMADCTTLRHDAGGNGIPDKPDRRKSARRIDGIVAAVMATSRAELQQERVPLEYEEEGHSPDVEDEAGSFGAGGIWEADW